MAWAVAAARDSQLSGDPLARAMANDMTHMLTLAQGQTSEKGSTELNLLDANDALSLYDARTPMPLRLWHLWASCSTEPGPQCADPDLEKSLIAGDPGNAFVLLVVQAVMEAAARTQMYTELAGAAAQDPCHQVATDSTAAKNSAALKTSCNDQAKRQAREDAYQGAEKKLEAVQASRRAEWLKRFDVANRYDDFAQDFKSPVLAAVKKRPLPPSWTSLSEVPSEFVGLLNAFPQHQWMAEVLSNALIGAATTISVSTLCAQTGSVTGDSTDATVAAKNAARCARLGELVLRNPKNSAASVVVVLTHLEKHPISLRAAAFATLDKRKKFDPTDLFKFDWVALREILARATSQGDVAVIPSALAWIEAQSAKLTEKTAQDLAAEADALKAQEAEIEARQKAEEQSDKAQALAAAQLAAEAATNAVSDAALTDSVDAAVSAARAAEAVESQAPAAPGSEAPGSEAPGSDAPK